MALLSTLSEILRGSSVVDILGDLFMFIAPLWIAVIVGVLVGWAWKPKWANFRRDMLDSLVPNDTSALSPSLSTCFSSIPSLNSFKFQLPSCIPWPPNCGLQKDSSTSDCRFTFISVMFSFLKALISFDGIVLLFPNRSFLHVQFVTD